MFKHIIFLSLLFISATSYGQTKVDLDVSVPLWMEYNAQENLATLKWIGDENASNYYISEATSTFQITPIDTLEGTATEYNIGPIEIGEKQMYHIRKDNIGRGIITLGLEIPIVHQRGRCLLVIDDLLTEPLLDELVQLMEDITMDGWDLDTIHVSQSEPVVDVKSKINLWYDAENENSQALFLLGHIPVPYSGNSAHDGHGNHQGAWSADAFYGEMDGTWTDISVNNESPSRVENKNIPNDGKYDQTIIPTGMELEIGRVDFHNLPAFPDDEIELTRQYLIKSHDFKMGNKDYPRRALVENNFGNFAEGFGQSGWRNFTTMFGGEHVSTQNYEVELETNKYLFSYACGGGSYTSCSGVGTTQNLWVDKELQTVFTMTFGSYFGDWDSQNNFLRSALGCGDILTNAWAGRPVWQLYDMSLGNHIGYSTKLSQEATGSFFNQGFSSRCAHIALMGDPTLRLHAMKPAANLTVSFSEGNMVLSWEPSIDATHGYAIYRQKTGFSWEYITEIVDENSYIDPCYESNRDYNYMVKAIRLEETGSGSYYNTSFGISASVQSGQNPNLIAFFADADEDGFGDINNSILACFSPSGYVINDLDCDDTNPAINPNALEIPDNDIDENCDGLDILVGIEKIPTMTIDIFPNPTQGLLLISDIENKTYNYRVFDNSGILIQEGQLSSSIDLSDKPDGLYWLELEHTESGLKVRKSIMLMK